MCISTPISRNSHGVPAAHIEIPSGSLRDVQAKAGFKGRHRQHRKNATFGRLVFSTIEFKKAILGDVHFTKRTTA